MGSVGAGRNLVGNGTVSKTSNITIKVLGTPVAKGSMKAFVVNGRAMLTNSSSKTKPWQQQVAGAAAEAWNAEPTTRAVYLFIDFRFPRPKGHFGTGSRAGIVKASAPADHIVKPDLDKLARCVLDALTGVVYRDDSQVTSVQASKTYGETRAPGVDISVWEIDQTLETKR